MMNSPHALLVFTNEAFLPEKTYVLDVLLKETLGLTYILNAQKEIHHVTIQLPNNKKVVIEDHFFTKLDEATISANHYPLPGKITITASGFAPEMDLVVIFGRQDIIPEEGQVTIGADLIASSFFMLTRYEELINNIKDQHNRFPATESVAYKHNFLLRPVVNEYAQLLINVFHHLGFICPNHKEYRLHITHDVDFTLEHRNFYKSLKVALRRLKRTKSLPQFSKSLSEILYAKVNKAKDPYNTFDFLMDYSEHVGLQSCFFFMAGGLSDKYDNQYQIKDNFTKKIISNIKARGHRIGFHPSYCTYNKPGLFLKEKDMLEEVVNEKIFFGRQHYLRFDPSITWAMWDSCAMEWDSTLAYADQLGFRSGICSEFPVFDLKHRKKLKLREKPLTLMEKTLISKEYMGIDTLEEAVLFAKRLADTVKKYKGDFVLLWHNQQLKTKEQRELYQSVLKSIL